MEIDNYIYRENLEVVCNDIRNGSKKIVTTNGVFDILHPGHLDFLKRAKLFGDILIVGVNSDASVRRIKGEYRPINNDRIRLYMLSQLRVVDYVTTFKEDDPREFCRKVKPTYHIKSKEGYKGIEKDVVEENGGRIILLPDIPGLSSTDIITKCAEVYKEENKL